MKCLILVGGYGTRLRPLTFSMPKPLVPFCNRPIVEHQIAAAAKAGVTHVILAVGYQPREMMESLGQLEERYKVKITCSIEDTPLGTAGPVRLARDILLTDEEPFFVFNSDVICDFPLKEMLNFHKQHGGEGTICVTPVKDPSKYGVVMNEPDSGRIISFVEKPKEFIGDQINAGLYILSKTVIKRIKDKPTMFEKDIFPPMADEKVLYCFPLKGYWADIGQPKDYLSGMVMHLDHLHSKQQHNSTLKRLSSVSPGKRQLTTPPTITSTPDAALSPKNTRRDSRRDSRGSITSSPTKPPTAKQFESTIERLCDCNELRDVTIIAPVLIHDTAVIQPGAVIGPHVTVGPNASIGKCARVRNTAVFEGAKIEEGSLVVGSIVGWKSHVGKWARLNEMTVLGENVHVNNEVLLNSCFVLPHKSVKDDVFEIGKVIM